MNNLSGQSLGRYHLVEKLGEGGMAVVYKAFDTRLECEVAVKVIRTEDLPQSGMEKALKRFEREAKAVAQLTHPNIVKVMDYGEQDGLPFLVMIYLPGGTMKQLLGKPLPYTQAARLLLPIAKAVQYAHAHNIIHRDIKPSNILIAETGEPLLTDFGIARILDLQDGQTLTGTGVGIGTPEYMAPEQWEGKPVDGRADIYALGVVLYEMITGRPPYKADTVPATMVQVLRDPLPRPSSFVPDLPAAIEQILFKALSKKPEDRYQNMQEFGSALEQFGVNANVNTILEKIPVPPQDDQFITMDTSATNMETFVEDKFKAPDVQVKLEPPQLFPSTVKEPKKTGKIGILAGLGVLIFLALFFVIGNSTNWFRGFQTIEAPTVVPTEAATVAPVTLNSTITASTPTLGINSTKISEIDSMEMVYVPAGDFLMGSLPGVGSDDECPQHTVYLDAYWIDKTEVTNFMYSQCVSEAKCTIPEVNYDLLGDYSSTKNEYNSGTYAVDPNFMNRPVVWVTWNQAKTYCEWAGRNLPTEAQWEKAARGTQGQSYPWGEEVPSTHLGHFLGGSGTTNVGLYPDGQSPYGALDMEGNVMEWVFDHFSTDYYSSSSASTNPTGPTSGTGHVLRGASYDGSSEFLRAAIRFYMPNLDAVDYIGFRCAMPAN